MNDTLKWFAVRVRSRHEKLAAKDLALRGIEAESACAPVRRAWADRVRTVEMPIFPGYIFARFDVAQSNQVLRSAGVVSIVGFGREYCPIEESEMQAVRIVVASGVDVLSDARLCPGTRVRVLTGALKGLEGVLEEVKNERRLVVSVSLLQRSIAVELTNMMVEPLTGSAPRKKIFAA
jgi:transcription antitermination factor NusG